MASQVALERLVKNSKLFKRGAEVARQEIFGNAPQLNIRTGGRRAKKPFTGPYLEKYYPTSIHTYARKVGTKKNCNVFCRWIGYVYLCFE